MFVRIRKYSRTTETETDLLIRGNKAKTPQCLLSTFWLCLLAIWKMCHLFKILYVVAEKSQGLPSPYVRSRISVVLNKTRITSEAEPWNDWCWLCIGLDISKCLSKTSNEVEPCNDLIWVQRNVDSIWRDYFISILKCFKEAILKHKPPWIVRLQDLPDWNDFF